MILLKTDRFFRFSVLDRKFNFQISEKKTVFCQKPTIFPKNPNLKNGLVFFQKSCTASSLVAARLMGMRSWLLVPARLFGL
jgi:hypothetical protein